MWWSLFGGWALFRVYLLMAAYLCRRCKQLLPVARSLAYGRNWRRHPSLVSVQSMLLSSSTEPLPVPPPDGAERIYPDKIRDIVDQITQLTLLETAQLNELLKSTLNIPDAPMMVQGGPSAPAAQESEPEEVVVQTEYTVKLMKYADDSKIKLIKEVKALMEGMNLVQAKKFVEGVPQVVQKDVTKDEAEKLKAALEAAGGTVEIE